MYPPPLKYALYLVTDSSPAILGDRDFFHIVEEALKGGVTIVQLRDKFSDSGTLVKIGRRLHRITQRYRVPLLINDRADVALAVGCEGVHVGQDDLSEAFQGHPPRQQTNTRQVWPTQGACWVTTKSSASRRARFLRLSQLPWAAPTISVLALSMRPKREASRRPQVAYLSLT